MIQTDVLLCGVGNVGTFFDGCKVIAKDFTKPFLLAPGANIDLATDSFDEAARADLIKKGQLVALNDLLATNEAAAKSNVQTLPNKLELFISTGLYKFSFEFEANVCLVKSLHQIAKRKWQLLLLDSDDKLFFDNKAGKFKGFEIQSMTVDNETVNDGGSKSAMVTVSMQFTKDGTKAYNERRSYLVDSTLQGCNGVQDVKVATLTTTHAGFKVKVVTGCDGSTPVYGLATANFRVLKASDGTVETITVVENGNGEYTISGIATATDVTVQLYDSVINSAITDIDGSQFFQSNVLATTLT